MSEPLTQRCRLHPVLTMSQNWSSNSKIDGHFLPETLIQRPGTNLLWRCSSILSPPFINCIQSNLYPRTNIVIDHRSETSVPAFASPYHKILDDLNFSHSDTPKRLQGMNDFIDFALSLRRHLSCSPTSLHTAETNRPATKQLGPVKKQSKWPIQP
jgi:hypothetical protein